MAFLRKLVSICLHHNILFKAKHIQGVCNRLADALSRLQVQTFRHLAPPQMDSLHTEIPQSLQPQNWVLLEPCLLSPVSSLHPFQPIGGLGDYFTNFSMGLSILFGRAFPIAPHTLATLSSHVSALGYSHKFLGHPDPSKAFFVIQILKGYGKIGFRLDSRLPITLPVLNRIIESSAKLSLSQYQRSQLQAMCSTAFFAFLRIGEISCNSPKDAGVPLQVHHLVN